MYSAYFSSQQQRYTTVICVSSLVSELSRIKNKLILYFLCMQKTQTFVICDVTKGTWTFNFFSRVWCTRGFLDASPVNKDSLPSSAPCRTSPRVWRCGQGRPQLCGYWRRGWKVLLPEPEWGIQGPYRPRETGAFLSGPGVRACWNKSTALSDAVWNIYSAFF